MSDSIHYHASPFGLGTVVATQVGGRITDHFGSTGPLLVSLLTLLIVEASIAYTTTSWIGAAIALFMMGAVGPSFFIAQQHRLVNLAPEQVNVITALNSSMNYLAIAGGAALGGVALSYVPVTQSGWISAVCGMVGLALLLISFAVSGRGRSTQG